MANTDRLNQKSDEAAQVMQEIVKAIGSGRMKDFTPDKFAEPNGLAERFVKALLKDGKQARDKLNPTQLRKFFHYVKKLNQEFRNKSNDERLPRAKIALLSAQLAYASGRKLIPDAFYQVMIYCLDASRCQTKEDFENVSYFLEAIMAYHKYHSEQKEGGSND